MYLNYIHTLYSLYAHTYLYNCDTPLFNRIIALLEGTRRSSQRLFRRRSCIGILYSMCIGVYKSIVWINIRINMCKRVTAVHKYSQWNIGIVSIHHKILYTDIVLYVIHRYILCIYSI